MSRTYRKFPVGVTPEYMYDKDETNDGIAWELPGMKKFLKREANRRTRREWLTNSEHSKLKSRDRLIYS